MKFLSRKNEPLPDDLDRRARGGLALFDAGQYAAAASAWLSLLADCERELGPHHRETITTLDRLGSALFRLRRLTESADYHREAHHRAVRVLGPNHPSTLFYANNLGSAFVVARLWDEALPVLRETLRRRTRKLGKNHADTLVTAKTLGIALFMTGDGRTALDVLEPAYERAVRTFERNDPLVLDIGNNLDIVRRNLRRY